MFWTSAKIGCGFWAHTAWQSDALRDHDRVYGVAAVMGFWVSLDTIYGNTKGQSLKIPESPPHTHTHTHTHTPPPRNWKWEQTSTKHTNTLWASPDSFARIWVTGEWWRVCARVGVAQLWNHTKILTTFFNQNTQLLENFEKCRKNICQNKAVDIFFCANRTVFFSGTSKFVDNNCFIFDMKFVFFCWGK
jgi:hypothetical protein